MLDSRPGRDDRACHVHDAPEQHVDALEMPPIDDVKRNLVSMNENEHVHVERVGGQQWSWFSLDHGYIFHDRARHVILTSWNGIHIRSRIDHAIHVLE